MKSEMLMNYHIKSFLIVVLLFLITINNDHHHGVVDAIYQEPFSFKSHSNVIEFSNFGFLSGGYFDINIKANLAGTTTPFTLMGCTIDEYSDAFDDYCDTSHPQPKCSYNQVLLAINDTQQFHGTIDKSDYYYFLITQCGSANTYYTISYALYNPGGNHLSSQYIPLPILYMVFTGIWVLLTTLWIINWIQNRSQNIKLHKVITLFPFSKLAMVVYSLGYWRYLQTYGAVGIGVIIFYWIFFIVFKVISCVVLLFIATGWGICKGRFEHLRKALYIIIVLLTATLALGVFLGGFFTILSFVVYIPVLCIIFVKSDANVRLLRAQISAAQNTKPMDTIVSIPSDNNQNNNNTTTSSDKENDNQPISLEKKDSDNNNIATHNNNNDNPNTTPADSTRDGDHSVHISSLYNKLHMFLAFKWIMLVYLTCVIILQFLSAAFPFGWIFDFFMLLVETVMFICIGITFRLRKQTKYYEFIDE